MTKLIRFQDLILGSLEQAVLETLWKESPLSPGDVHSRICVTRSISINTVSSALKRLYDKDILARVKVSHSYVYSPKLSRADLQRELIGSMVNQFPDAERSGLLSAFVDIAESHGEETLRRLETLVSERLGETE